MNYNLLQIRHDRVVDRFIEGKIVYSDFEIYEKEYLKMVNLFIINLN
jgi:hypothetical protein